MRFVPLALTSAAVAACSGGGNGNDPDAAPVDFDRRALVRHVAADLLEPTYARFATDAAALVGAIDAHCTALATNPAADPAAARAAWATAVDTWEVLDQLQVGPVAQDDAVLRYRVYGWPLLAPCTLDQDVVARAGDPASYDVTIRLDNARTLAGLEYLLHYTSTTSSCALSPAGWDTLAASPADLARARCGLAAAIAADVRTHADQLATAWSPTGGNYVAQLTEAGTSASSIPGEREAVNMISDGLFYVDRMVKDMKMGEAAGITVNSCNAIEAPCLREMEHRFADRGTPALRINLRALRAVFTGEYGDGTGGSGPGFDDYLIAVGAPDVAARMTANLDAVVAAADALPDSYTFALEQQRADIVALHAATRNVTNDMKSQFLTVLGLDIPQDVAGDVD